MKRSIVLTSLSFVLFLCSLGHAQYTQKWYTTTSGQLFLDAGNTDADPQNELLVGYYTTIGADSLFLLDGATGQVEWKYGYENIYMGLNSSQDYTYASNFGPHLVDVDNDGVMEIVFWTGYTNPAFLQYHCYDSDVSVGVGDREPGSLPKSVELGQNYPNPFNPTTTISYSVSQKSHVTITIFNILGEKVATIVDEVKSAGEYAVEWDGTEDSGRLVSSGVYFYALQTDEKVDSKKMLLIK